MSQNLTPTTFSRTSMTKDEEEEKKESINEYNFLKIVGFVLLIALVILVLFFAYRHFSRTDSVSSSGSRIAEEPSVSGPENSRSSFYRITDEPAAGLRGQEEMRSSVNRMADEPKRPITHER